MRYPIGKTVLVLISLLYLLQCFTPLRLGHDSVEYLTTAASIADGQGVGYHAFVPLGYPMLVAGLDKLGIAASWSFVLLNCLGLALGIVCAYSLLGRAALLALLSFLLIKNAPVPATDCIFFGLFFLALYLIGRADGWRSVAVALLVIALAYSVRRIGIALVPALLWKFRQPITVRFKRLAYAAVAFVPVAAFALFRQPQIQLAFSGNDGWLNIPRVRALELGEIAANVPATKLPAAAAVPLILLGIAMLFLISRSIYRQPITFIEISLVSYVGILFLWPFYDPRFWIPVIPIIAAKVAREIVTLRWPALTYAGYFVALGIVALAFTTRITFAGDKFPQMVGDGSMRATYEYVLHGTIAEGIKDDNVPILRRYY